MPGSPEDNDREYQLKIREKVIRGLKGPSRSLRVVSPDLLRAASTVAVMYRQRILLAKREDGGISAFELKDAETALDAFWAMFEQEVGVLPAPDPEPSQ